LQGTVSASPIVQTSRWDIYITSSVSLNYRTQIGKPARFETFAGRLTFVHESWSVSGFSILRVS